MPRSRSESSSPRGSAAFSRHSSRVSLCGVDAEGDAFADVAGPTGKHRRASSAGTRGDGVSSRRIHHHAPAVTSSGGHRASVASAREIRDREVYRDGPAAVRVVVRFRPPVNAEEQQTRPAFVADPASASVESADLQYRFNFDRVFAQSASQQAVYDEVGRPVVDGVLEGYHGTILAYGQTGSGKTYCMFGPQGAHPPELQGVVPRAARRVFDCLGDPNAAELTVECSFFEVYCGQVRDLLRPSGRHLQVAEFAQRGVCVEGLTSKVVTSAAEALQLLRSGLRLRSAANTRLNQHSSRSHAIFSLRVHQRASNGTARHGKLTLVDLAGSEKVHKSGSAGEMLEEAKKINSSLSALGHVIDALADRRPHVPYRDSRLTRILEDSLGGNCRTTLLVACSPSTTHAAETLSSLRFAARAKKVCNSARANIRSGSPGVTADRQLLQRIAQLRRELASAHRELEQRFAHQTANTTYHQQQSYLPLAGVARSSFREAPPLSPPRGLASPSRKLGRDVGSPAKRRRSNSATTARRLAEQLQGAAAAVAALGAPDCSDGEQEAVGGNDGSASRTRNYLGHCVVGGSLDDHRLRTPRFAPTTPPAVVEEQARCAELPSASTSVAISPHFSLHGMPSAPDTCSASAESLAPAAAPRCGPTSTSDSVRLGSRATASTASGGVIGKSMPPDGGGGSAASMATDGASAKDELVSTASGSTRSAGGSSGGVTVTASASGSSAATAAPSLQATPSLSWRDPGETQPTPCLSWRDPGEDDHPRQGTAHWAPQHQSGWEEPPDAKEAELPSGPRRFSWLIEAIPLTDNTQRLKAPSASLATAAQLAASAGVVARHEVRGGQPVSRGGGLTPRRGRHSTVVQFSHDSCGAAGVEEVHILERRLQVEQSRCAALTQELERRAKESRDLKKRLEEAEAQLPLPSPAVASQAESLSPRRPTPGAVTSVPTLWQQTPTHPPPPSSVTVAPAGSRVLAAVSGLEKMPGRTLAQAATVASLYHPQPQQLQVCGLQCSGARQTSPFSWRSAAPAVERVTATTPRSARISAVSPCSSAQSIAARPRSQPGRRHTEPSPPQSLTRPSTPRTPITSVTLPVQYLSADAPAAPAMPAPRLTSVVVPPWAPRSAVSSSAGDGVSVGGSLTARVGRSSCGLASRIVRRWHGSEQSGPADGTSSRPMPNASPSSPSGAVNVAKVLAAGCNATPTRTAPRPPPPTPASAKTAAFGAASPPMSPKSAMSATPSMTTRPRPPMLESPQTTTPPRQGDDSESAAIESCAVVELRNELNRWMSSVL